jgi:streptogramin lyase
MSVHDAEPQDIYVDAQGKLWRCIGMISEPTALFEEVEAEALNINRRQYGGVSGLMWNGFKRIYRRGES